MLENNMKKYLYLLCFLIFYIMSGSPFMTIVPSVRNSIYFGIVILIPFVLKVKRKKHQFMMESLLITACFICVVIGIIHNDSYRAYISLCATFIFSYLFANVIKFNDFICIFQKMVKLISTIDLILYFVLQLVGQYTFFIEMVNSNAVVYKIGYVFNYIKDVPVRNCSIFWEPGIYASIIIVSLILEYVFSNEISKYHVILMHICMLTTFSSAGIVLMLISDLILLNRFLASHMNSTVLRFTIFFILFITLGIAFFYYDYLLMLLGLDKHEFYYKLMSYNLMDSTRVLAITHNLELFKNNPLIGVGIFKAYANSFLTEDTSTTTFMMAEIGIIGCIPSVTLIVSILRQNTYLVEKLVMLFCFLSIINKEPHLYIVFVWVIMFGLLQNSTYIQSYYETTIKKSPTFNCV